MTSFTTSGPGHKSVSNANNLCPRLATVRNMVMFQNNNQLAVLLDETYQQIVASSKYSLTEMFTKLSELDFQKVYEINLVFPDHSHLLFLHKDTLIENVLRTGTSPFFTRKQP